MMATGVTSFVLARAVDRMLVPLSGALFVLDLPSPGQSNDDLAPRKIAEATASLAGGAPLLDAKVSSDGSTVAFVCDNEVYALGIEAGGGEEDTPRRLTFGATAGITNGVADCESAGVTYLPSRTFPACLPPFLLHYLNRTHAR